MRALVAALLLSGLAAGCADRMQTDCEPLVIREHAARGADGLWRFDVILTACERPATVRPDGCRPLSELHPIIEVDGREYHLGYASTAVPANVRSCDPLYDPATHYDLAVGASQRVTGLPWDGSVGEREGDANARRLLGPQTLRVAVAGHATTFIVDVGP